MNNNGEQKQYIIDGQLMTEQQAQMYYQQMQQMAQHQQSNDESFNTFSNNLNQNQLLQMYEGEQQNFENEMSEEAYEEGQHDSRVVKTVRSLKRQK